MTISEFKKFSDKLSQFCTAPTDTWKKRILLKSIYDNQFMNMVNDILNHIDKMTSLELDQLFEKLRNLSNDAFKKFGDSKDPIQKYKKYLEIEVYFGVIEQIDELSSFSDRIGKEMYEKYGNETVAMIDKENPSVLTSFQFEKSNINFDDELIKKYLVLKKWQDLQYIYCNEVLDGICHSEQLEEEVIDLLSKKLEVKDNAINLLAIDNLFSESILDIDLVSKYYLAGIQKQLVPMIGGKGYGLAILNIYSSIPKTYVIPINHEFPTDFIYNLPSNIKYSVRSSADVEDGRENSFAGMFSSYLDVNHKDLKKYYDKVKDSVNSDRVQSYIQRKKAQLPKMAVIIEEFVEPQYSGVWLGHNLNDGVYEMVLGNGEKLVSGEATPFHLNGDDDKKIKNYFIELQNTLEKVADFEWCVIDNKIVMLQYRPVTSKIKLNPSKMDGYGVSSGIVSGEICFLESLDDVQNFEEDKILLTYLTDPDWTPYIMKSKGVVTAIGGYLCHTAIITRELGIPCVTNIGIEKLNQLRKEKEITIDGDLGTVESKKKLKVFK